MKKEDAVKLVDRAVARMEPLHDWNSPDWSILDDRRGDLPDFPIECLGKSAGAWVKRAADGAGVTPAHVAVPALGIASSLTGMARRASASSSWHYPMTCWTAVVGASGTGKTPGLDAIKRALDEVTRNNRNKIDALRRQHETKVTAAKAARDQWKKRIEEAMEAGRAAPQMPEAATDPGKFIAPRLYISSATIERVGELLQARPQGALLLMDELAALFMNMSRYSGGEDNQFWLEAWNGSSSIIERMNRSLQIDHLLVGVVGGVQPDKLARSFEGDQDGMYARFLFAWPPVPAFRPLTDDATEADPDIQNVISRLDRLAEVADGNLVKRSIPLSAEARAEFEELRKWAYREREALDGRERDWVAKAEAHVLRLSGTLCLLDWASKTDTDPPTTIALDYMRAAIRLVREYFWPHARAALRQIGLSDRHVNARRVLRWIRAHRRPGQDISREDIRRDALGQKLDAEWTSELLAAIARAGWVREKRVDNHQGAGRPVYRWEANPALWTSAAQTDRKAAQTAERTGEGISAIPAIPATGNENGSESEKEAASKSKPLWELNNNKKRPFSERPSETQRSKTQAHKGTAEIAGIAGIHPKSASTKKPQQNTEKLQAGNRATSGNGKAVPTDQHRCALCGSANPPPNRVSVDGLTIHLHRGCEDAYMARHQRVAEPSRSAARRQNGSRKTPMADERSAQLQRENDQLREKLDRMLDG